MISLFKAIFNLFRALLPHFKQPLWLVSIFLLAQGLKGQSVSDQVDYYRYKGKDYNRSDLVAMTDRGQVDSALMIVETYLGSMAMHEGGSMARAIFLQAELLFFGKRCEEAITKSKRALELLGSEINPLAMDIRDNLALAYNCTGNPQAAIEQLNIVVANAHVMDATSLAKVYYSLYNCYLSTAEYHKALEVLLKAKKIYVGEGNLSMAAIMDNYIGEIYHVEGEDSLGYQYKQAALDYFLANDESDRAMFVYLNRGGLYADDGLYELAERDLSAAIEIGNEVGNVLLVANAYERLGDVHMALGDFEQAQMAYNVTKDICEELDFPMGRLAGYIGLGEVAVRMADGEQALHYGQMAKDLCAQHDLPPQEVRLLALLADAHGLLGNHEEAYRYRSGQVLMRDSLFNVERSKIITELKEEYEGEKKLRKIEELENQAEIERLKRNALLGGIGLLFLLSVIIINREIQRRKKAKLLHETEKKLGLLEQQRLKEQLDHKNRELTSNALNMARKNEFLTQVNDQLIQLNTSKEMTDEVLSLRNQLKIESQMEDNWEQFTAQFTETNPTFYTSLKEKYPELSKGELRMAALLRMNLSNKDIAHILNISDDGVKKARYRMRKKFDLQTDDSLEEVILGI